MGFQSMIDNRKRWDNYFITICKTVANNSRCLSRQIGAILVRDKSIISTGYNGSPRGLPHCGADRNKKDANLFCLLGHTIEPVLGDDTMCPRYRLGYGSGEGLHLCTAAHAEVNCIANAARQGVITLGSTMYMTCGVPCKDCLSVIINAGVEELVCSSLDKYDDTSKFIIENSFLKIRAIETKD